jgi:hypothetical protein
MNQIDFNQGDPAASDWVLWGRALSITFCGGQERRLITPLGSWSDNEVHHWKWFLLLWKIIFMQD